MLAGRMKRPHGFRGFAEHRYRSVVAMFE